MTRECQEDEHDWTGRRNQQDDKVESELLGHAYLDWMHMDLDIDTTVAVKQTNKLEYHPCTYCTASVTVRGAELPG